MLVLFLVRHALSVTFVLNTFCPCDATDSVDPGCSCDPAATAGLPESYPLRGTDFLPTCPATAFQTNGTLNEWLPGEIFCLKSDRRGTTPKVTYSNTFDVTYVPESMPTPTPAPATGATLLADQGYTWGEDVLTSSGTPLTFPGVAGTGSSCQSNGIVVRFLQDINGEVCQLQQDTTGFTIDALNTTFMQVLPGPTSTTPITVTVTEVAGPTPTPGPSPSPTVSPTPSATLSLTVSLTPSPTVSPTVSVTMSATSSPPDSPWTPSPTVSPTESLTLSPTPSATYSTTLSPTISPTISPPASQTAAAPAQLLEWWDDSPSLLAGAVVKSISALFLYDIATSTLTSANITVETYAATDQPTTITVQVQFLANTNADQPKSGDVGYAFGQPVIAGFDPGNGAGYQVNADQAGSFPMPFGTQCASATYTPLLFGIETISGCEGTEAVGSPAIDLSNYNRVAIYGRANVSRQMDWVNVTDQCAATGTIGIQRYYFFWEKFGDTMNPQNRIVSVVRQCETQIDTRHLIIATFVQRPQTTFRYKPPNPRVPGIPPDTFYPFSAASATMTTATSAAAPFSSPSRIAIALSAVCACVLFLA